ncbi:hypothetical protein ACFP3I_10985 [Chryseobacterium arachidis]|uniref:hypothetical protein n=1 Tax=Chryseobacterium arachidis TaxID=1416778 RepID=UPI00360ECD8B
MMQTYSASTSQLLRKYFKRTFLEVKQTLPDLKKLCFMYCYFNLNSVLIRLRIYT